MKFTTADIRRLEASAIRDYGIPSHRLMENAGRGVSDFVARAYPASKVLLVIGKGNNGGDGLVAARHLAGRGFRPSIVLLCDPDRLKSDPLRYYQVLSGMSLPVFRASEASSEKELLERCRNADLVVDAIFGVGLGRPVDGIFAHAIRAINRCGKPVVSIDIPSGLDADTGAVHGVAVKATQTLTLALPKLGLYSGEGPAHAGLIETVDIGIPSELLDKIK